MLIKVTVPGSCGELLQGISEGRHIMVTCPIDLYSRVWVTDAHREIIGLQSKAKLALQKTLSYLGQKNFPFGIELHSDIPVGKGMASSSADIGAVCLGAAAAFGYEISPEEIGHLAAAIEPTDGVFFPGVVKFDYMTGERLADLTDFPCIKFAIFDCGGAVDTLSFHCQKKYINIDELTGCTVKGFWTPPYNLEVIGRVASLSAWYNQAILYKKALPKLVDKGLESGAVGFNIAHSGTVIGLMFSPHASEKKILALGKQIAANMTNISFYGVKKLVLQGAIIAKDI